MAESRISFPGPRSLRSPFPSVIPPAPQNSRGGFSAPPDGGALQLHAPGCFSDQLPETPELQFGVLAAAQAGDSLFQPTVALQREETRSAQRGAACGPTFPPGPTFPLTGPPSHPPCPGPEAGAPGRPWRGRRAGLPSARGGGPVGGASEHLLGESVLPGAGHPLSTGMRCGSCWVTRSRSSEGVRVSFPPSAEYW